MSGNVPTGSFHKRILRHLILKWKIHEFLKKELPPLAGYYTLDLMPTSLGHQKIIIYAKNPGIVVGRGGRKSREIIEKIQKTLGINVKLEVHPIKDKELNAQLVAEEIARAIGRGTSIRRVAYSYMQRAMENGAIGIEIRIRGKLQKRRSKRYRFAMGTLIHSGDPGERFVDEGKASILVKTGVIGVKVRIVKPNIKLPDKVNVKYLEEVAGDLERLKQEMEDETKKILEKIEISSEEE